MATKAYTGYLPATPTRGGQAGRWHNDDRVPALRLRVPPRSARADSAAGGGASGTTESIIQPIAARALEPFAIRETACSHLEHRSQTRRCLVSDTQEITLDQQVAYCLGPRHRECSRYRSAEGLPKILPKRMAVYTLMIVAMIALIVAAGIQTARHDARGNDGASVGIEQALE